MRRPAAHFLLTASISPPILRVFPFLLSPYLLLELLPPLTSVPHSRLADGNQLMYAKHEGLPWETPTANKHLCWAIATARGVVSDIHVDATGYATRVYVIKGIKLWLVGNGEQIPHPVEGWQPSGLWHAVILYPGDEL